MSEEDKNRVLVVRQFNQDDISLIYNSWLKEYRYSGFSSGVESKLYFKKHKELIDKLLAESNVIVLCDQDEPSYIVGYMVYTYDELNNLITHYIYIKNIWRKMGLGIQLYKMAQKTNNDLIAFCTHHTKSMQKFIEKHKLPCFYNPYLLLGIK